MPSSIRGSRRKKRGKGKKDIVSLTLSRTAFCQVCCCVVYRTVRLEEGGVGGEGGSVDTLFFADTHTPLEFFLSRKKKKNTAPNAKTLQILLACCIPTPARCKREEEEMKQEARTAG